MINCQVCEHNPTGERCELFGRVIGMHGCSSGVERKPRNHFEMVKAMSMEQMAAFIAKFYGCSHCPGFNVPCDNRCQEYWLEWLKEEVEE